MGNTHKPYPGLPFVTKLDYLNPHINADPGWVLPKALRARTLCLYLPGGVTFLYELPCQVVVCDAE